jgi:hypothetical protein
MVQSYRAGSASGTSSLVGRGNDAAADHEELLAYIALSSKRPLTHLLADLDGAAAKTSPDIVPLTDVDRDIHEKLAR